MIELLHHATTPANFIATGLLLLIIGYWLTVIIGLLDFSFLDFDIELDVDADQDLDTGAEASVDWLNQILIFFNLGKMPFMVWLSFLTLPFWFLYMSGTAILHMNSIWIGLILFIPILLVSLFAAKFLTIPFIPIFNKLDKDDIDKILTGKRAQVTLSSDTIMKGQAKVYTEGAVHLVYIKSTKEELNKGDEILLIDYHKNGDFYTAQKFNY